MTTKIEWTNETWNPVSGCSKVSQGCKYCYAERIWPKVAGAEAKRTGQPSRAFTDVRCHPDRLEHPLRWRAPKRIFVNSMSDLFHADVPFAFIDEVWGVMIESPQHTFQILTKRPERMRDYASRYVWSTDCRIAAWPLPNVWLGVSVEDQAAADERIPMLLQTPAAIRFVSYEPALGPVNFRPFLLQKACDRCIQGVMDGDNDHLHGLCRCACHESTRLHWVIAGGESGPDARPAHPDWFRSARDQCAAAGVAFFFKQWGEWTPVGPIYSDNDTEEHMAALDTEDDIDRECHITQKGYRWRARFDGQPPLDTWAMRRVGKKTAGRLLDGCTWNDYPA